MNPEFLKGLPAFKRAALDAVGQWQYTPALNNGKPVEQQIEVSLDFNPSTRAPAPANSNELADVNARQPIATQAGFVPAQLMSSVRPAYPALAKQWLTTGTVVVRVKVDKDGRVVDPEVLRGPILFRHAALDAVKRWQYRPATANGQPIEQQVEVRLDFRPQ
jgi:protein TonB